MADVSQNVAHRVDLDFIETDFLHFLFDAMDNPFFIAAFAGNGDHVAQETRHVFFVVVCFFKNQFKRNVLSHDFSPVFAPESLGSVFQ